MLFEWKIKYLKNLFEIPETERTKCIQKKKANANVA